MYFLVTFVVFELPKISNKNLGMSSLNQKTVKEPISFNGVGLHSGKSVNLTINPTDPDTGIIFKRIERLKRKIHRRNMKKQKIRDTLLVICKHQWVPNLAEYNVYDRPKYCKICGIDK